MIDTVPGKQGTGVLVAITERIIRFYLVKKISSESAEALREATIDLLRPNAVRVYMITADKGF